MNNTLTKSHKFKGSNSSANPLICDECHEPKGFKVHQASAVEPVTPAETEKRPTRGQRLTSRGTRSLSMAIPVEVFAEIEARAKPEQSPNQVAKDILLSALGYEFVEAQPARKIAAKPAMYRKRSS